MAFERSSSADTADFTEGILKYDCLYNEFSKDYKNKYTKMKYWSWRNVIDKFDMSPEDAKKVKNIRYFSALSDHSDHMETGLSLGSPGFFSDSGDPSDLSDYMETGL